MRSLDFRDDELAGILKSWASQILPPPQARLRLMRLARQFAAPHGTTPVKMVLFQPFVPLDWSRFTFNWETTQIFQLGLPWNRHIA